MPPQYSRIRSTGGNYIHPGYNLWSTNGYVTGPDPVTTFDRYTIIKDSPHRFVKGTRRYPVGDCFHEVWDASKLSVLVPFFEGDGSSSFPQEMRPMIGVENVAELVPDFPSSLRSQLNEEAFIAFATQFPEEISLSEFILGLGQIKALFPRIQKMYSFKDIEGGVEESVLLTPDVIQKRIKNAYLGKKFGWDNLLSDLRTLSSLCSTLMARISFLKKTRGKPTRIGYYKANCFEPLLNEVPELFFEQYSGWGTRLRLKSYRCDYRATATLYHLLDHLDDIYGLLRAGVGAFGLANPLKAIWVNLPFSFVVDWFFKVSTHLDRLATVKPAELWNVYDVTHSTRIRAVVEVFQDNSEANVFNPLVKLGEVTVDQYDRRVGLPIGLDVYTPSNLSPSQLTLLLAMLA